MARYRPMTLLQGDMAPDFEMTGRGNSTERLSDYIGQYVLLDFWGSWCGPCRKENPALVELYNEMSNQKLDGGHRFTILSIGLETSEANWRRAIEQDGLIWPHHYTDLSRMKSPIAQLYGVREIPTKFLINPDGYIVGINQTTQEIKAFLASRMDKM